MIQTGNTAGKLNTSLLHDYAACNLWANKLLVTWLRTKPAGLLTQVVPSSFPSLRETLVHIWDVERCWLGHLQEEPVTPFRFEGFNGTTEEILEGIISGSEALLDYVSSQDEAAMQEGCFFSIPYVGDHTVARYDIVQHTLNHSSYHRGQLITIGRNLGLTDAPMTDYMFYLLRVKNAQE